MNWLLDPLQYPFMQTGLIVGAAIAAVCAVFSCILVLRGWSLMGDAVSHAVLPGIVLASICKVPLPVGAFVSGLFCALASGWLKSNSRLKEDTSMGVVFTGLFALGLVMMSKHTSDLHLDHILFGNVLGVSRTQMFETVGLALAVLLVFFVLRRDFMLNAFDPAQARALGRPVEILNYILLGLLALTIVAAMQAVGLLLVVALLVTPGATAFLLARRFDEMLWKSIACSVGASVVGVYVSFYLDGSAAGCIVLAQAAVFLTALLFAPGRGLLRRASSSP